MKLDCRGKHCPLPVIELARPIEDVEPGDTIEVAAWCRMRGHDYVGESKAADGVPVYSVRRRA